MLTETEVKNEILEDTLAAVQAMRQRDKEVFVFETIPGVSSWSVWSVPAHLRDCTDDWDNPDAYDLDGIQLTYNCSRYDAIERIRLNRLDYGIRTQWEFAGNIPFSEESLTDSGIPNVLYELLLQDFHAYELWVQGQQTLDSKVS